MPTCPQAPQEPAWTPKNPVETPDSDIFLMLQWAQIELGPYTNSIWWCQLIVTDVNTGHAFKQHNLAPDTNR